MLYVCVRGVMYVVFLFVVWNCRCSCMGSMSVSSCICCMFVSCVHPVAVLKAAFCMTRSLLMLVEEARGDHVEEAYSSAVLFIFRSILLLYTAGYGVNRAQVVLSRFSVRLFYFDQAKTLCRYGCKYLFAALVLVCVDVMVMSSAYAMT